MEDDDDPDVVAITAIDARRRLYRMANTGAHVDFSAPGVAITAAAPGGGATQQNGTSHAAAIASVVIAAERRRADHEQAIAQLERRARDLGAPGRDARFGAGLLVAADPC